MREHELRLEECHPHALTGRFHDHGWKQDQVISPLRFRVHDGTAERILAKDHVGVCEQKPVATRLLPGLPHGVCLPSQPAGSALTCSTFKRR